MKLVQEDLDVFGDGSVMIVYTPGHTPGHQSCLVHLAKTGWILLSGDAVHLQENWDKLAAFRISAPCPPSRSFVRRQLSMQRMADLDFLLSRAVVDQS